VFSVSTPPPAESPSLCFTIINRGLQYLSELTSVLAGGSLRWETPCACQCGPVALMPIAALPPFPKFPDPGIPAPACAHSPACCTSRPIMARRSSKQRSPPLSTLQNVQNVQNAISSRRASSSYPLRVHQDGSGSWGLQLCAGGGGTKGVQC
jgi:hypothetical protein